MHHFLSQVVALVVASAVIAYICNRLRILPIVGFLLAGVLIGPNALGVVDDAGLIDSVAEIGIVLLLFTLGIEFSLDRVWRIKREIFLGGGLQLALTIGAAMGILALLGVDWRTGFYSGALIALSSTAIVLKVLGDRGEVTSPKGQLSLGILIFQDLAIVALVLILPMLSGDGGSAAGILRGLGMAALIVTLVVIVARRVMPHILERVARTCSQEIFLLTIIAICLGTAWLTSLAGVSLSLGAFLAGLVVSESRYSHHAFAEILPLQILFSAVFFVSVGLLLDLSFVARHPLLILAVVAAVVVLKVLTTGLVARLLGYGVGVAGATALLLAQIGEFAFVLERVGRAAKLSPAGVEGGVGGQTFIAAAVLLMAVTPLLAKAGDWLQGRHETAETDERARLAEEQVEPVQLRDHVIVAGYGAAARPLTRVLHQQGVPFVILTLAPVGSAEAAGAGWNVIVGDYRRRFLLDAAAIGAAKVLVIPDDVPDVARRVAAVARDLNPRLRIIVRTAAAREIEQLVDEGADEIVVDELESGVALFSRVLETYELGEEAIAGYAEAERTRMRTERHDDAPRREVRTIELTDGQRQACRHATEVNPEVTTAATGCEDCLRTGDTWVHLRVCMECGGVRCCDDSPNRHATKHYHATSHPVIRSYEPGELWAWCYADKLTM